MNRKILPAKSVSKANKSHTLAVGELPLLTSLRRRLARAIREKDGSMAIETAVVLPIFFLLLFGIFELSMLLTGYCSASYAVRMGARWASVRSSTSLAPASVANVQSQVQSSLYMPGVGFNTIVVSYTGSNNVGTIVSVGMVWTQQLSFPGYHATTFAFSTRSSRVIIR